VELLLIVEAALPLFDLTEQIIDVSNVVRKGMKKENLAVIVFLTGILVKTLKIL